MSPIHSETQALRKIESPASAEEQIKESVPHLWPREGNEGQTDEREHCFVAVRDWGKKKDEREKNDESASTGELIMRNQRGTEMLFYQTLMPINRTTTHWDNAVMRGVCEWESVYVAP